MRKWNECEICQCESQLFWMSEMEMLLCPDCYRRSKDRLDLLAHARHYLGRSEEFIFTK